jgi:hypothetical protein
VLGLIYIFLVAKPFSIRRLCVLFILALVLAMTLLCVFHAKHTLDDAVLIATSLVLLAWAFPLSRAAYDTIRFRRLTLEALHPVSEAVQWTYGAALAAVPITAMGWFVGPMHRLVLGLLPRLMTIAALCGFGLLVATSVGFGTRRIPGRRLARPLLSAPPADGVTKTNRDALRRQ